LTSLCVINDATVATVLMSSTVGDGSGYCGVAAFVIRQWARKTNVFVPIAVENEISNYLKTSVAFCVDALKALNSKRIPVTFSNGDSVIHYRQSSDMRECFVPLNLEIDTSRNVGFYEIDFKIHSLTLQGIKFGVTQNYSKIYSNPQFAPYDIVGGYIGVFNSKDSYVVCWDGFTRNIINKNQWLQTNGHGSLEANDVMTMIIDTKYKLMHLRMRKHDAEPTQAGHNMDVCCFSFKQGLISKEFSVFPCISLLFYKDCIEISGIRHYLLGQHVPHTCSVNNDSDCQTYMQRLLEMYLEISYTQRITLCAAVILLVCVCGRYLII